MPRAVNKAANSPLCGVITVGCSSEPANESAPASKIVGTDCRRTNLNQRCRNQVVKSEYFFELIPLPTTHAATFPG